MSGEELLRHVLETRFCAGVHVGWDELVRFLYAPWFPGRAEAFKAALRDAIVHHRLSPAEFEKLTSVDQDTQEDVDRFLTAELWEQLYPGEPLT